MAVPEGWGGCLSNNSFEANENTRSLTRGDAHEIRWEAVADLLADGYKKTNTFTFPTDGVSHYVDMLLYNGDEYDAANRIDLRVKVSKATSGVDSIESASDVRYYNLQGAEVANPESGIYVKVCNGKTSKVVVK